MSLISTQNLVAPLTNTVHLITIVLVAVSFAILRLMGASLSIQQTGPRSAPVVELAPVVAPKTVDSVEQELFKIEPNTAPAWAKPKRENNPVRQPARPSNGGGLDDIEKALGM